MNADDLDRPLGFSPPSEAASERALRNIPWAAWALCGLGVLALSLAAFPYVMDRFTPAPPANLSTTLETVPPKRIAVSDVASSTELDSNLATGSVRIITPSLEQEGGVKIIQRHAGEYGEAIVIRVPQEQKPSALAPAPDPRLVIAGPYGPLPRIARDGTRPLDVYLSPLTQAFSLPPHAPRLALVVSDVGAQAQETKQALQQETQRVAAALPGAVTFALASTGPHIMAQAEIVRAQGHEFLLQVPMEGHGADEGLGTRPLMSSLARGQIIDGLHWHMSRASGYIGLTHLQGARFMASASALSPVLQNVAERGLMFFDDGTSRQAMTSAVSLAMGAPSLRADLMIDMREKSEAQEAAFRKLETLARERGSAIGVVRFNMAAIDRLARFAQGLEARGIALVPLSALLAQPAHTVAR